VKEKRLAAIAPRGLLLPAETLEQVRKTGIRCRPQLDVVYQQQAKTWKLRGEESGGAVELLGHYVGFVDVDGCPLPWLQRVQNFLPNGTHAVIVGEEFVRVEMFWIQNTYDLLITKHWLDHREGQRAEMRNAVLFAGRYGFLETEQWGKDAAFRGGVMPHFLTRSGEPGPPDSLWTDATLKATEAACCCGCRHSHLLEAVSVVVTSPIVLPNEKDSIAASPTS
jgi:hypothetical protein